MDIHEAAIIIANVVRAKTPDELGAIVCDFANKFPITCEVKSYRNIVNCIQSDIGSGIPIQPHVMACSIVFAVADLRLRELELE